MIRSRKFARVFGAIDSPLGSKLYPKLITFVVFNCVKLPLFVDKLSFFCPFLAEHCVTRFHKGVARREWVLKKGIRRNEALDIFVYNFVALKILNPNFEVLEKNMVGLEAKPLKKVNKPYKIRREGSFVSGFR